MEPLAGSGLTGRDTLELGDDVVLMPGLVDAVSTHATVGEIVGALADVFGRHREDPII